MGLRGSENRGDAQLGYVWLVVDEVFPFFALCAAASDLRDGRRFDRARAKIDAQRDTLIAAVVRHAVLGTVGCGVFLNPRRSGHTDLRRCARRVHRAFDCIVFAGFYPSDGPRPSPGCSAARIERSGQPTDPT